MISKILWKDMARILRGESLVRRSNSGATGSKIADEHRLAVIVKDAPIVIESIPRGLHAKPMLKRTTQTTMYY
jgi:hypothetical protein